MNNVIFMKVLFVGSRLYNCVSDYVKNKGITSILSESNPNAINLDLPDKLYLVSRGMDEPMKIAINENVDAVIPLIGIDPPLLDVGIMKDKLEKEHNIPVIASDESVAKISINKKNTKDFFLKHNILTPDYYITSEKTLPDDTEYPIVLKQSVGQGGVGVLVVNNAKEAEEYLAKYDETIVEKFIDGYEISVEVLSWNNNAIPLAVVSKGKTTLEGIHPLEKVKTAPANIPGLSNKSAKELALKIVNLLGGEGNIDVDLVFEPSSGNLYAIEINTRPSGTRYLTAANTSINPLEELVNMANGDWDLNKLEKRFTNYFAIEIPVHNYTGPEKVITDQYFVGSNSWVVHGPKNYERVSIRAENQKELDAILKLLNIDL